MDKPLARALFLIVLTINTAAAAEREPLASPEVTAAMRPYLDSYKLAGVIGLIADKSGKVHYKNLLGYHLRNGMFGHDGAYGTDLSVNPTNGMVAVFMVQCPGPDQWAARDLFLKTATEVFQKDAP